MSTPLTRAGALLTATALAAGMLTAAAPAQADEATQRYVVTTVSERAAEPAADDVADAGGEVIHRYEEVLPGFSAELTRSDAAELRADPRVATVAPDVRVSVAATQFPAPWGLDRLDQRSRPLDGSYGYTATGSGGRPS